MALQLLTLDRSTWLRSLPLAAIASLVIAIPTDLIDTPIFGRPVPPRPIDYIILVATAALIGLILAIRAPGASTADEEAVDDAAHRQSMWGGAISFLAVGCPVCNQAVVALVGTSGALAWWAPIQPLVGAAAIALLAFTLRKRLATRNMVACPI